MQGFTLENRKHGADTAFCKQSIREHQEIFNHAPKIFGYDRGGDSDASGTRCVHRAILGFNMRKTVVLATAMAPA